MIFPCFKRRKEKEYDSSFIEEFAEQVKIDKKQHLIRKVDIDMISMELNNVRSRAFDASSKASLAMEALSEVPDEASG